jgi:hypothetical protein
MPSNKEANSDEPEAERDVILHNPSYYPASEASRHRSVYSNELSASGGEKAVAFRV